MNGALHWLKARIIGYPRLRALLRRHVLAPYQLHQLRRIANALPVHQPNGPAPTILVLALRPWPISRAWETVLTRILKQEGCRVVWATCGRVTVRCDGMLGPNPDPHMCSHCDRFNGAAAKTAGVEHVSLAEFAGPAQPLAFSRTLANRPELRELTSASLQRILASGPIPDAELTNEMRTIRDELLASADRIRDVTPKLLERVQPDAVLALNGKFYAEAAVLAEARRRGIATWTYERGNRRNTIVLSNTEVAVPFDTRDILEDLEDRTLSSHERAVITAFLDSRSVVGNGQIRYLSAASRSAEPLRAGVRSLVALFTNLIWDSSVVGEDTIFASMFEWIVTTIRELRDRGDVRLVIRIHPAEEKVYWHRTRDGVEAMLRRRFPAGLPSNVSVIAAEDPLDSYDLIRKADLVLVYSSTVGMEAAAAGKRVVVAGNSNFAAAPFVVRPRTEGDFRLELQTIAREPPRPDAPELALRFMYRLFYESSLDVPNVLEDPTGFRSGEVAIGSDDALRRRVRALVRALREVRG